MLIYTSDLAGFGPYVWPKWNVTHGTKGAIQIGAMVGAAFDSKEAFGITASTTLIPLLATFTYSGQNEKVRPFIGVGAGLMVLSASLDAPGFGFDSVSGSSNEFAVDFHGGLNAFVSKNWFVQLRSGVTLVFNEEDTFTGVPVQIGVGARF